MQTGNFQIMRPYMNFLLAIPDLSNAESVLLISGSVDRTDFPVSVRDRVTTATLDSHLPLVVDDAGKYDVVFVIPTFGRLGRSELRFPPDWEHAGMGTGYVEDAWLAWGIYATRRGGQTIAATSPGMLNSTMRQSVRQKVLEEGLEAVVMLGAIFPESSVNTAVLVLRRGQERPELLLVDATEAQEDIDPVGLATAVRDLELKGIDRSDTWGLKVEEGRLTENLRLDPDFYHPRFLQIEPPNGYDEYALADIAEIQGGRSLSSLETSPAALSELLIPFVQVSNITLDGNLSLESVRTYPATLKETSRSGWAEPGDILITVAGTLGKACIVPDSEPEGVFFDTSIRRVKVSEEVVSTKRVYEFLRSEPAQLQLERYSSGSVIPTLSSANLGSIRVFVPQDEGEVGPTQEGEEEDTETFMELVARTLQEKVVTPLLNTNETEYPAWREDTVEKLRGVMRQVQKDHEPLDEVVTRWYPLPIALAYRRLVRAYHNPYEQVSRLIELYETLTYFFYYTLLSDFLRSPQSYKSLQSISAIKSGAKAYKSYSMADRLRFVRSFLKEAKARKRPVFMPELMSVDLYTPLDRLRQIRNEKAHSAAGTAAAQKSILEASLPAIQDLLDRLRFLKGYPLCRIESFYTRGTRTLFRAEFFQGALYETDIREQEVPAAEDGQIQLLGADCEHVILLSPEFDWLDLHPFYQVIALPDFKYESHLCFHKQVSNQTLSGESVQVRTEVELPGADELDQLMQSAGF